jgi:hypothetical protein
MILIAIIATLILGFVLGVAAVYWAFINSFRGW